MAPSRARAQIRALETSKAIASIERLIEGTPGGPVYLAESRDFWDDDWTYDQVLELEQEVGTQYQRLVEAMTVAWGPPAYAARHTRPGFPDWCPGIELACWSRSGRTIALWWEHQDKELPILLVASAVTEFVATPTASNSHTASTRGKRPRHHGASSPAKRTLHTTRRGTA